MMLTDPSQKYRAFPQIDLPNRQWPGNVITSPPRWLSTDLRDGNQALIDPMNAEKKSRFFDLLVKVGVKEIEVGFPSAGATEFVLARDQCVTCVYVCVRGRARACSFVA